MSKQEHPRPKGNERSGSQVQLGMRTVWLWLGLLPLVSSVFGCAQAPAKGPEGEEPLSKAEEPPAPAFWTATKLTETQEKIVSGARDQLTWGTSYDPAYVRIPYPNGDVDRKKGVCTDVVIRALRHAGYDLQQLVHEDMKNAWSKYPRYPSLTAPDSNIDHRRVPNQAVFFERHGKTLTNEVNESTLEQWQPGDFVWWKLYGGRDHIGVLTDKLNEEGYPYVIHNLGGPDEEDVLTAWKIVGHYRYP